MVGLVGPVYRLFIDTFSINGDTGGCSDKDSWAFSTAASFGYSLQKKTQVAVVTVNISFKIVENGQCKS